MTLSSPYLIARTAVATASVSTTTVTATRMLQTSTANTVAAGLRKNDWSFFSLNKLNDAAGTATTTSSTSTPSIASKLSALNLNHPRTTSYKYPFPSIPRPRRNLFYYYNPMATIKRGLRSIPESRPGRFVRKSSVKWPSSLSSQWVFRRRNGNTATSGNGSNITNAANRIGRGGYGTFIRYGKRFASTAAAAGTSGGAGGGAGGRRTGNNGGGIAIIRAWKWWAVPAVTTIILWTALRRRRQQQQKLEEEEERQGLLTGTATVPKPAKPWQVAAYSTLPLKAISRLWGRVNDITLPIWMREPGFKFYSYVFGANLDEVAEEDLTNYANLGEFFFRELKPGVRPIDPDAILVSPADGKVLHLGVINDRKVEQVKGITYSLDALLGGGTNHVAAAPSHEVDFALHDQQEILERHKEFAVMNGISYTLDDLIGDGEQHEGDNKNNKIEDQGDATLKSVNSSSSSFTKVSKDLFSPDFTPSSEKELFFTVIYLAPGDYHRFHSPTNWVTEVRRHFVGELYSVAPYFQSRLQGLFCLNERVALLGRWKYGFFSMTPVGATNVGSIRLHFDKNLQTNTVYEPSIISSSSSSSSGESLTSNSSSSTSLSSSVDHDSVSSSSSSSNSRKRVKKATCYEATYARASRLLGGYPLSKGDQMGGFNLGSTVVLVFEAPKSFQFKVKAGERVKVGQALGSL